MTKELEKLENLWNSSPQKEKRKYTHISNSKRNEPLPPKKTNPKTLYIIIKKNTEVRLQTRENMWFPTSSLLPGHPKITNGFFVNSRGIRGLPLQVPPSRPAKAAPSGTCFPARHWPGRSFTVLISYIGIDVSTSHSSSMWILVWLLLWWVLCLKLSCKNVYNIFSSCWKV